MQLSQRVTAARIGFMVERLYNFRLAYLLRVNPDVAGGLRRAFVFRFGKAKRRRMLAKAGLPEREEDNERDG